MLMMAHNFLILSSTSLTVICLFAGCSMLSSTQSEQASELIFDSQQRLDYIKYIKENQENKNEIYSRHYNNCKYLVDSDAGTTLIQNLINPELVFSLMNNVVNDDQSKTEKAFACFNHIINNFRYYPMPESWPTIAQTIKIQKGDCKGLSLLLVSSLISIGIDECYAAISNNHMWVEVKLDDHWKIFETDININRNLIYQSSGFYENPMFRIYSDRSEKRIRIKKGRL